MLSIRGKHEGPHVSTIISCNFCCDTSGTCLGFCSSGTETKTGYAAVHGLKMYYRIQGAGRPLVLLHGALSDVDTDSESYCPNLRSSGR